MPIPNILSTHIINETWSAQGWGNMCCWQHPTVTYNDFLTGMTEVYNNSCLKDRIFSDYETQLFRDNFIIDTFVSAGTLNASTGVVTFTNTTGGTVSVSGFDGFDSYWSANTNGSISNSGLTVNVGIGTQTANELLTVAGDISGTTDLHVGQHIFSGTTNLLDIFNHDNENSYWIRRPGTNHIYNSGTTTSFVGIGTAGVTNALTIVADADPVSVKTLSVSENNYVTVDDDGVLKKSANISSVVNGGTF